MRRNARRMFWGCIHAYTYICVYTRIGAKRTQGLPNHNLSSPGDQYILRGKSTVPRLRLREFPPLSRRTPRRFSTSRAKPPSRISLSRLFRLSLSLSRHSQRPPLSLTGGSGVCVHRRQSPSIEHFYDSFRLESPSHPADKRAETWWGGVVATAAAAAAASVRRVQTSTSGLGLVSLVTAPHKGIAL